MQTKGFFDDGSQEREVRDVRFLNHAVEAHHCIDFGLRLLPDVWVCHELRHNPLCCRCCCVSSGIDQALGVQHQTPDQSDQTLPQGQPQEESGLAKIMRSES